LFQQKENMGLTMKTIFDELSMEKIEAYLNEISNFISKGYDRKKISEKFNLKNELFEELFSIAKANLKNKKFKRKMFMNQVDLRFATPDEVAYYRAYRLKCDTIVELGSGIGGQTIPFSEVCKKVIAVELDERKMKYAEKNCEIHGRKNIEFMQGDLLDDSIIKKIKKADIIFFDSERPPEETERTLESVKPDINRLIKKYSKITKNIAVEIPPQIIPEKITLDCEKEYVSLRGQLNRLTLYFGNLKRAERSVVSLPDGFALLSEGKTPENTMNKKSGLKNYLHEISEAVVQSDLLDEFAQKFNISFFARQKRINFFTSEILLQNSLVKNFYVLEKVQNDFADILNALKKHDASEVVLRGNISPDRYWEERKRYESRLNGKEKLHLFIFQDCAVVAKEL
jgi:predicted O-methyltransferase YrrM